MSQSTKAKNYCFTYNNYPEDLSTLDQLLEEHGNYAIYGKEICPTTGTPHLQGYLQLKKEDRITGLKKKFNDQINWRVADGSAEQNKTYCSKDGLVKEIGTIVSKGQRSDLTALAKLVTSGATKRKIAEDMPEMVLKFSRGIETLQSWLSSSRTEKTQVYWFYGATGTGKSHKAFEMAPNAYFKMADNKWWDGYEGHEDVIVEDYRRDFSTFSQLLRLLDKYPLMVEAKGSTRPMLAKRIFFTTPKSPQDTWEGRTEEDLAQLLRRVENIWFFNQPWHYTLANLSICDPIKIK